MNSIEMKEKIEEENPDALFADGYDEALVAVGHRFGLPPLAVYNTKTIITLLMTKDGMTYDEAVEHFSFNIIGAGMGENTPIFLETEESI